MKNEGGRGKEIKEKTTKNRRRKKNEASFIQFLGVTQGKGKKPSE